MRPFDPHERYIPTIREKALRRRGLAIGNITPNQKRRIKRILFLENKDKFPRCPHKSEKQVEAFEEKGDYSHSGKDHICNLCRCRNTAGSGTKGDFYGLGIETGHYGVGYCKYHSFRMGKSNVIRMCDLQVRCMQLYGESCMTDEQHLVKQEEQHLAEQRQNVREDINLVV